MSNVGEWDFDDDDDVVVAEIDSWASSQVNQMGHNDITIEQCLAAGPYGVMIDNEVYHALDGISGSNLTLLAESNRHLDNKRLFNLGNTPALAFGTLLHTQVLEPEDVENRYIVMPAFNGRSSAGKEEKKRFVSANQGKTIIAAEDFENAQSMATNVRAICGHILDSAIKERSLFVKRNGLILKCRLDADLEDVGDDYDLKSITLGMKDFSDHFIEAHIKRLKYHWSAAFRNIIRRELGKPVRDSYLIFCNTGPGYMVRVIKMNSDWISETEILVDDMLERRSFYLSSTIDNAPVEIDDGKRKYNVD